MERPSPGAEFYRDAARDVGTDARHVAVTLGTPNWQLVVVQVVAPWRRVDPGFSFAPRRVT
jgi:hypothetical protein